MNIVVNKLKRRTSLNIFKTYNSLLSVAVMYINNEFGLDLKILCTVIYKYKFDVLGTY